MVAHQVLSAYHAKHKRAAMDTDRAHPAAPAQRHPDNAAPNAPEW